MLWKKLSDAGRADEPRLEHNGQESPSRGADVARPSEKRLEANRENAKKSTGPRSIEGKAKVSQNRVTHGLTGAFQVLPGENAENFDKLLNQLMADEKPVGIAEIELVKKMAQHFWCSERASRFQEGCFLVIAQTPEQLEDGEAEIRVRPELERYTRYQSHHDRAYARASAELLKRRKERRQLENGFESQRRAEAQEKRREANENRQFERHKTAVATDQKKLELTEMKLFTLTAAATKRFNLFEEGTKGKTAA